MIHEIQECRHEFEAVYGEAIISGFASYYATAKSARIITRERFLHICTNTKLPFVVESPPEGVLDLSQVDLCLRTGEGVFDAGILRRVVHERLSGHSGITLALGHEVVGGALLQDGRKRLDMKQGVPRVMRRSITSSTQPMPTAICCRCSVFPSPLRFDLLELPLKFRYRRCRSPSLTVRSPVWSAWARTTVYPPHIQHSVRLPKPPDGRRPSGSRRRPIVRT
jgi:hypothetical protein